MSARSHDGFEEASLARHLESFVQHASSVLPHRSQCSITLRTPDGDRRVASSDERAARCDELELAQGIGPCLDAVEDLSVVLVPDLAAEPRWTPWTEQVRGMGFRAVGAFPAHLHAEATAALNVYCEDRQDWGRDTLVRCDVYAQQLATVIDLVLDVDDLVHAQQGLERALTAQSTIDQALGVLIVTRGCDASAALDLLQGQARAHRIELADAAHRILQSLDTEGPEPT